MQSKHLKLIVIFNEICGAHSFMQTRKSSDLTELNQYHTESKKMNTFLKIYMNIYIP